MKDVPILIIALILFFSSSVYSSKFIGNAKDGWGAMFYDNGDFYSGSWKDGKKDGRGIYCWAQNRERYVGGWKKGKMEGFGVNYYPDASVKLIGTWKEDEFTTPIQTPVLVSNEGLLYGTFQKGFGIYAYRSGNKYDGTWDAGKKNGGGVFLFHNGGFYYGNFSNDKMNGGGVYYWDKDNIYIGNFKDDIKDGDGVLYGSNGIVLYSGLWKDGKETPSANASSSTAAAKSDSTAILADIFGVTGNADDEDVQTSGYIPSKNSSVTTNLVSTNADYTNDLALEASFTMTMLVLLETVWPGVFTPRQGQVNDFSIHRVWDDRSLYSVQGKYQGHSIDLSVKSLWSDKSEYLIKGTIDSGTIDLDWRDIWRNHTKYSVYGKTGGVSNSILISDGWHDDTALTFTGSVGQSVVDFAFQSVFDGTKITSVWLRGKTGGKEVKLDAKDIPDREAKMFSIKGNIGNAQINMRLTDTWGEGSDIEVK